MTPKEKLQYYASHLGCEVETTRGKSRLRGVNTTNNKIVYRLGDESIHHTDSVSDCQLLLTDLTYNDEFNCTLLNAMGEYANLQRPPVEVEQGKCESCGKPKPSNAYLKCPACYGYF